MSQQQPDARTALATRQQQQAAQTTGPVSLDVRIQKLSPEWAMALPRGVEAVRFVRDALTCLRTIPKLGECDPESVLGALMTCAQLGLRPGVLGHAWPLPFWDSRTSQYRAQLVIGYQGLVELGHRSGQISSLIARTVYENDEFDVDYGLADRLVHKPQMRGDRGQPVAYYAIAKFVSGGHAFIVMTQADMVAHRDRYAPRNRQQKIVGPWVDNFEAMAMKTTIRQLAKYMPKSTELAEAVAADGGVRVDLDPGVSAADVTGTSQMWDGQVLTDTTDPIDEAVPAKEAAADPAADLAEPRKATPAQLRTLHAIRNKLEGFAGDGEEAKALFLVHIAAVLGREVESTKDLTSREASEVIDDLQRALEAQTARQQQEADNG